MTNIEHPDFQNLANKNIGKNDPRQKVHTIAPPEDAAFMQQMAEAVNNLPGGQAPQPAPILNNDLVRKETEKKAVLEKLVLFKQAHYKEVDIGGVTFRFKLLNADENVKVYNMIRELAPEEQLSRSPIIMLAASLVDANGIKIEDTYVGPEVSDPMVMRYHELCGWNMPIINALVSAYRGFVNEVEGEYTKDFSSASPQIPSTD